MQAGPALQRGPTSLTGAPLIALRPSAWLRGTTLACMLIAVAAVQTCLAATFGTWQAVPAGLVALAILALGALRHWRAEPDAIKIGPDGLTVWNRTGQVIAQGRIAGCSQWSGRLLILAVAGMRGRSRPLLIPADALSAGAFRELVVLGRHGSRA